MAWTGSGLAPGIDEDAGTKLLDRLGDELQAPGGVLSAYFVSEAGIRDGINGYSETFERFKQKHSTHNTNA